MYGTAFCDSGLNSDFDTFFDRRLEALCPEDRGTRLGEGGGPDNAVHPKRRWTK
jgi:hypothetical protein